MLDLIARKAAIGRCLIACSMLGLLPLEGWAQEVIPDFYKEPGLSSNRSYVNQSFSEHIDPFTGALQLHYVDVHLPGNGGFDLSVSRSYNSASINETNPAAFDSQAGLGWSIHFGRVLNKSSILPCSQSAFGPDTLNNPVIELPDGSTQLLAFSGTASPLMYTTQRWKADCAASGIGLVVYSPDGTRYDMTQQVAVGSGTNTRYAWYTTKITDRNGNNAVVAYTASASPKISTVTTNDSRTINFLYNPNGFVSSISTSGYSYAYNYQAVSGVAGAYFLSSVTRPGGTTWQYQYNAVLSSAPGSYALKQVIYPEGGFINYGYGSGSSDYVYFDSVSNAASRSTVVKTKSTSDGGTWTFAYAPGGSGIYDTTTVNAPSGTSTYRHIGPNYASSGSLWQVGLLMQKQIGSVQTEAYTWTSQAISSQQYKRPGAWRATRLDSSTNAPVLASRSITRDGQAYATTFSGFDAYGNPGTVTESGPNGGSRTTTLTYFISTAKWIVRQVQNQTVSGGVAISRSFDGNGNLQLVTRDGVATSYSYDSQGNVSQATFPRNLVHAYPNYKRGIALTENQPEGVSIVRLVSDAGNMTSETNGEVKTTSYGYDGLNRVTSIGYPQGNAVGIGYTAASKTATRGGLSETTAYDGFGRTASITLGGITRSYGYDPLGRRTFVSNPGSSVGTGFQYDILDRLVGVTNADGTTQAITYGVATKSVRNERNHWTTYTYRAYGDPDRPLVMWITAPDSTANVTLGRNGKDLVTSVGQGGFARLYDYDSRGYLTSVVNPETGTTIYGRDAAGNMTSRAVGSSGATIYGYDFQNRLAGVTYPGSTPVVTKTYSRTHKLKSVVSSVASRTYGYDNNDNLTSEAVGIDGLSLGVVYTYNGNDQLSAITYPRSNRVVSYSPDALGRPAQVSGFVTGISYWPSGQINQITYANSTTATYGQNSRLWLASFSTARGSTGYLGSNYGYDGVGNLTSISDGVDGSYNRTLGYDALSRVSSASGAWGSGTLSYDGSGNLRSQVLGSTNLTYSYNGTTNLLASVSGSRAESYGYDSYGDIVAAGGRSYGYDGAPNMTCANCNDPATSVQYQYDGLNQRVSTLKGGVKTYEFYSSNGNLLVEYTPSQSNRLVEYIYLGGKRIAQLEPTVTTVNPGGGGGGGGLTATAGRPVTLTASVSGTSPSGTMSFYDGSTLLGTATVAAGSASLTVTITAPGTHTITVNYSGDAANAPSSSTVTLTVLIPLEQLLPILNLLLDD